MVLTLGALLAEVAHTRPIRLVGSSYDPELSARLGLKPTRYEGPTGIVGVLNIACREARVPTVSLWANVPHYVSGIENPRAALALVRRVLSMLDTDADLTDLREAAEQFDQNLSSIVAQNAKIAEYVRRLERKSTDEDEEAPAPAEAAESPEVPEVAEVKDELPPSGDLVAEIEQFLRQQRPKDP
jgi:predicted ATP-grasp superfamily ATP-dependent carboligase